ncbi:MAG: D-2-hydroxyacid dehydrogenase [Firmicutes bacterium]|nr:D-2-hydroxyacid dehydrogenase [Bacillota bacterium]
MKAVFISKSLAPQVSALGAKVPGWQLLVAGSDQEAAERWPDADVLVSWGMQFPKQFLAAAKGLRWIQTLSAGVEGLIGPVRELEHQGRSIILANARGAHGEPIAEHVLGMILSFTRRLLASQRAQAASEWVSLAPVELAGQTVGIAGFGSIGQAIAAKLHPLGVRLLATRARPQPHPLVEKVLPPSGLREMLAESDVLILAAPATAETRFLIGEAELAQMKPEALLINIARGSLIDEAALATALRAGRLGGAALDVFAKEPLPADSPLWQAPNLLITPHIAALSPRTMERTLDIVAENLLRFAAGEPLRNVVDTERGY